MKTQLSQKLMIFSEAASNYTSVVSFLMYLGLLLTLGNPKFRDMSPRNTSDLDLELQARANNTVGLPADELPFVFNSNHNF